MFRVDRESEERKVIEPQPEEGEPAFRWSWDTPMQISPHSPTALCVTSNMVFKSTDRGHSWTTVSPDLTAQIEWDNLTLMGVPASDFSIARHDGVSTFGTVVTFAEWAVMKGLYYACADDGTVQVT